MTCPDCGGLKWVKLNVPTSDANFGRLLPCPNEKWHAAERLRELYRLSGLHPGEQGQKLDGVMASDVTLTKCVEAARALLDKPRGWLYLHGGPGLGKTLVLKALVCEFVERGTRAHYSTFAGLLEVMRSSFRRPERAEMTAADFDGPWRDFITADARTDFIKGVSVLGVDEFDAHKINETPWAREWRSIVLEERYRLADELLTVFAGNQPPSQWPEWLRSRIGDGRFTVLEHRGGDMRPVQFWRE